MVRAPLAALRFAWWAGCAVAVHGSVDPDRTKLTLTQAEYDGLTPVPILSPVPLSGGWIGGHTMRIAAELAMDIINSQQKILPGYRLNTTWFDDECNPDVGPPLMLREWNRGDWAALGANGCSAVCRATALLTPSIRIPHVSYGCAAGFLADSVAYPNFARMMTDESSMADVFQSLGRTYSWTRMVIITGSAARFDGPAKAVQDFFANDPIEVEWLVPRNPAWDELIDLMTRNKLLYQRVFIVLGYEPFYRRVVCASYKVGMPQGSVWLSVGWHKNNWWREDDAGVLAIEPACNGELITEYYNGGIGAAGLGAPLESDQDKPLDCMEGYTPRTFRALLEQHFVDGYPLGRNVLPGDPYTGIMAYGADGICMWAFTFRYMIFNQSHSLSELFRPTEAVYNKTVEYHKRTLSFFGVSGDVGWRGANNLPGILAVNQIQGGQRKLVKMIDLQGQMHDIPGEIMKWGNDTNPQSSWAPCVGQGEYRAADGSCQKCRRGSYYYSLTDECLDCDIGKYNPMEGGVGPTSCSECAGGKYSNTAGSSECFLCAAGNYSTNGQPTCQACPEGQYQPAAGSRNCLECADGNYSSTPGSSECLVCAAGHYSNGEVGHASCKACPVGQYQPEAGGVECNRCQVGRYRASLGGVTCTQCNGSRTTKFLSAFAEEHCVCPQGFYEPALPRLELEPFLCLSCPEGMTCAEDSRLAHWPPSSTEDKEYPRVKQGFFSTAEDPTDVYRCLDETHCPGGDPGTCAAYRTGLACGRCAPRYYDFGGKCNECTHLELSVFLFPLFPVIIGPVIVLLLLVRLLEPFRIKHVDSLKNRALALVFFFLVFFQTLGITRQMNLTLPSLVSVRWEELGYVNAGVQFLRPECAGSGGLSAFAAQFVLRTSMPLLVGLGFLIVYGILRTVTKWRPHGIFNPTSQFAEAARSECAVNAFFTVVYSFSIAILAIAFDLFKCFDHPNGLSSLRVAPDVLCNSSDWTAMLAVGILAILVYFVGMFALFTWVCCKAPSRWRDPAFRKRWKFLFVKWRPDVFWFGQVFLLKGALINVALVFFRDGILQILWVGFTLILYTLAVLILRAWRHRAALLMDILVSLCLLCATNVCVFYGAGTADAEVVLDKLLLAFTIVPMVAISGGIVFFVFQMFKRNRTEVESGVSDALEMQRMSVDILMMGTTNLLRGAANMTQCERKEALWALRALASEGSGTSVPGWRISARDAVFGPGSTPESVYREVTDAETKLHYDFRSWCGQCADPAQAVRGVFGDSLEMSAQSFQSALKDFPDPLSEYVAALCDIYDDGVITREAFTGVIVDMKRSGGAALDSTSLIALRRAADAFSPEVKAV